MSSVQPESEEIIEVFEFKPGEDPPHLNTIIGFIELDMPEDAWNEIEKLTLAQKKDEQIFDMKLQILTMMSKWETALELASSLAAQYPENYAWPTYEANFLRELGRLDDAFEVAKNTAERNPDAYPPHYTLAIYACLVGKVAIARTALKRSIAIWPSVRKDIRDDPELEPIWDLAESD